MHEVRVSVYVQAVCMGCACKFDTSKCACSAHDCVGPVVGAEGAASVRRRMRGQQFLSLFWSQENKVKTITV